MLATAQVFSVKIPAEILTVSFDFVTMLGAETISTQVVTAVVFAGTDAAPSAIISGAAAVVDVSKVAQKITGGLAGVDYYLECKITTNGARTLIVPAILPVR